jgi:hypothetical protein
MKHPLNMPQGSVRAILALLLVTCVCLTAMYATYKTGTAPEGFFGMAGIVIGYYFGTRKDSVSKEAPNAD